MNPVTEERISTADLAGIAQRGNEAPRNEAAGETHEPLLPGDFVQQLHARWDKVQTGFVDEPREAVRHADELVAETIQRLAQSFAEERNRLERQWDRGDSVDTEELRQALRKYRSFFQRLLTV